jgi:hypothetical protein
MRVGALPGLRIGDIKKFEEHNLYLIWVYNNSRKDRYYTFCTPECAQAIDDYLAYRKRLGEEIKETNPLIRNKISVDNPSTCIHTYIHTLTMGKGKILNIEISDTIRYSKHHAI